MTLNNDQQKNLFVMLCDKNHNSMSSDYLTHAKEVNEKDPSIT